MVAIFEVCFFIVKYVVIALKMLIKDSEMNSQQLTKDKRKNKNSNKLLILP